MTARRRNWIVALVLAAVLLVAALLIAASLVAARIEPFARQTAILYLSQRFQSDVQLQSMHLRLPGTSALRLFLTRGRGISARVEGQGLSAAAPQPPRPGAPVCHSEVSLRRQPRIASSSAGNRLPHRCGRDDNPDTAPRRQPAPAVRRRCGARRHAGPLQPRGSHPQGRHSARQLGPSARQSAALAAAFRD